VQAQCPQCSTPFQLPDEKVPERPFKVRCPKCQHVVDLPGKAQAGAAPPGVPEPPPAPAEPPKPAVSATPPTPPRREHTGSEKAADALVALADAGLAKTLTSVLARLDYNVDVVEDVGEGARLLEQGAYALAVTSRDGSAGGPMTLAQRMLRLTSEPRRGVFVALVGDDFSTADGTQAWAAQADLVINPRDAEVCENVLRATLAERKRLYQPYLEARRRIETE
jgi:predicted Zn finger-like uncharacterized protein